MRHPTTTIAVSPEQLLDMAEFLVDARLGIAGIHHGTEQLATELSGLGDTLGGGAAASVQRALSLLAGIDGSGVPTLAHLRGAVFQAEMACRKTREQALDADRNGSGGAPLASPSGKNPPPSGSGGASLTPPAPKKKDPASNHKAGIKPDRTVVI